MFPLITTKLEIKSNRVGFYKCFYCDETEKDALIHSVNHPIALGVEEQS